MWRSCFSSDGLEIESWNVTMAFPCSLHFVWTVTMLACLFSGVTVDATPNWLAASWRLSANRLSATSAAPKFEIFIASICLVKGLFCRHIETRQVVKRLKNLCFWSKTSKTSTALGSGTRVTKNSVSSGGWKMGGRMIGVNGPLFEVHPHKNTLLKPNDPKILLLAESEVWIFVPCLKWCIEY